MITIYEFLEDHDNSELSGYDWQERMQEAVDTYNEEHGTEYNYRIIKQYQRWAIEKSNGGVR